MNILLAITWIAITQVIADGHNPISQPAANSIVPTGVLYTIKWSPGTPGPVFIALLTNTDGSNITTSTSNTGTYSWTPDPYFATHNGGRDYFLQICDIGTHDCTYTFNGRISFVDDSPSTTSVLSSSSIPFTSNEVQAITSVSYTQAATTYTAGEISSSVAGIGVSQRSSQILSQTLSQASSQPSPQSTSQFVSSSNSYDTGSASSKVTGASVSQKFSQPILSSGSLFSTSVPIINSGSSPTASVTPGSSSDSAPGSFHGLSTFAKIAIGVIVSILGTVALITAGFVITRRRTRRPDVIEGYIKPELSADSVEKADGCSQKSLSYGTDRLYELPSEIDRVYELGTDASR